MHKQQQAQTDSEEIRKLQSEVTQLRVLLSKVHSQNEATIVAEPVTATGVQKLATGCYQTSVARRPMNPS